MSVILKPKDVADALSVSSMTVLRMIRDGKIPAFKVGQSYRIYKSDLDKITGRYDNNGIIE